MRSKILEDVLGLVCWLRRRLPRSREQRALLRRVLVSFDVHNEYPLDPERASLYRGLKWSLGVVDLDELGVWDEAQGMPHEWCRGNVLESASCYGKAGEHNGRYHEGIQWLLESRPIGAIIVVDGRLRRGRERCARNKWSIDDGCMRALAMALKGEKRILCYKGSVF